MIPGRTYLRITGPKPWLHNTHRNCTQSFPGVTAFRMFSLYLPVQQQEAQHHEQQSRPPLHILFCGSDHFSATSLNVLHREHLHDRTSVASIDVVCRKDKRVGRGLRTIKEGGENLYRLERDSGEAKVTCYYFALFFLTNTKSKESGGGGNNNFIY